MELKVRKLVPQATVPHYAHPGDSGLDLFAAEACLLAAGASGLVKTGIALELPPGTEAQVRPRSGMALKHGLTVLNTPGTIDEGYRGEVGVILINHGRDAFLVEPGMKIAQMVIKPVLTVSVVEVDALSTSHRGEGGFGSTGYGAHRREEPARTRQERMGGETAEQGKP